MNLKNILLALTIPLFIGLTSCSKYEEGPKISLKRKIKRLEGEWKVESIEDKKIDYNYSIELDSDGDCRFFNDDVNPFYNNDKGKWKWEDNKSNISFTWDRNGAYEIQIKKLTDDEFWFDDKENKLLKCSKK